MPFYLFSDNCSEKEDFYHALLSSQGQADGTTDDQPVTQMFDTEDMIKLVRALHTSDDQSQVRWLNALAGRLFLGIYKTNDIENFIRAKIEKKIARVPKPTFITSVTLQHIDLGESAPTVSNPKLREITVDGGMVIEADVKYSGGFKVVISAVATIELGARFKPRTVTLVLATILKRLEGHAVVRVKPPPSNRLWVTFETMPRCEVSVEPIVSSRQITYSIILRAIESRIREVLGETLVYPNADDFPFFNTEHQAVRGGIWQPSSRSSTASALEALARKHAEEEAAEEHGLADLKDEHGTSAASTASKARNSYTSQVSSDPLPERSEIQPASPKNDRVASDSASLPPAHSATPPMIMRSNSFASAASPVITRDDTYMGDDATKKKKREHDATRAMKELSTRSHDAPPVYSPTSTRSSQHLSPTKPLGDVSSASEPPTGQARTSGDFDLRAEAAGLNVDEETDLDDPLTPSRSDTEHSNMSKLQASSYSKMSPAERKAVLNQSINSATAAAKKWGINVLNRQQEWAAKKAVPSSPTKEEVREPYGRGQPLPPPGVPLPRPAQPGSWSAATLNALRRKPVVSPQLPPRTPPSLPPRTSEESTRADAADHRPVSEAPPALPIRRAEFGEEFEADKVSREVMEAVAPEERHPATILMPAPSAQKEDGTDATPAMAPTIHITKPAYQPPTVEDDDQHDADDSAWLVDDE